MNPKQTEKGRIMKQKPRLILFVAVFYLLFFITLSPLWGDVAAVKGALKEKGDNFVIVKVSEAGIFKAGSLQTFYLHPKTKIIMAGSETPLVMDSLLIGDQIQVALGKVEKTKDGKLIQYVDKIMVLSARNVIRQ